MKLKPENDMETGLIPKPGVIMNPNTTCSSLCAELHAKSSLGDAPNRLGGLPAGNSRIMGDEVSGFRGQGSGIRLSV